MDSTTAFQGFRNQQYRRDPNLLSPVLETVLADAYWPGDAAWGTADLVDFLIYPFAVGTAREAGPVLANFLERMPNLEIVHFIGHSLGCRVVLETILALAARPQVGKVCLMAAAIPIFQVEWGGRLEMAMVRAQQVLVLYSGSDIVLTGAFPPGQFAAGRGEGVFPVALGHERPPPTVAGTVDAIEISGAGHGDYWGHSNTDPSWRATARAGEFMGFGTRVRDISRRGNVPQATGPVPRKCAGVRNID
jgi:pimeloyl-ACP methyl ester carboxylesterase